MDRYRDFSPLRRDRFSLTVAGVCQVVTASWYEYRHRGPFASGSMVSCRGRIELGRVGTPREVAVKRTAEPVGDRAHMDQSTNTDPTTRATARERTIVIVAAQIVVIVALLVIWSIIRSRRNSTTV